MKSYFLPLGLTLAFIVAWLVPWPGRVLGELGLIPWMVVIIFLVNGYQTRVHRIPKEKSLIVTALLAVAINLLLSPFVGLHLVTQFELPDGAALGLVVMSSVPATLSSGIVMTQLAGGDGVKALALTIMLNLIGVFILPLTMQATLGSAGIVELSPLDMLLQLIQIVLMPFVLGMLLRRSEKLQANPQVVKYLPSLCVVATVWMSISSSTDTLREISVGLLSLILLCAGAVHGLLQLLCWGSRRLYKVDRAESIALLFTASQKTLPVAIGVLTAMDHPAGLAIVACILFHFLQLFWDAILASRMAQGRIAGAGRQ
ncbi:MAG: bile acid:sodium symporter [Chromatiaceae bacterium]|nr:bile acid:sodium symporter [Chromatiaceae bacterium]MCP5409701.1 bile acid:sodium symporter [Chromatiaceae bacterium]MCP5442751.1 bile acid:sodium symporter [Chromatiaceae bacterium]